METTTQQPMIPQAWIGCLACYNAGALRGRWITAEQAADEMLEGITYGGQAETTTTEYADGHTITRTTCAKCGGDEFDVFDQEHIPTRVTVGEFYDMAEQLDEMSADTLEAFHTLGQWLGGSMTLDELHTYHEDNYCGQWDKFQDFAEDYAEQVGDLQAMPDHLRAYFDTERYARDLEHDYYHDAATGHTWRSV